MGLPVQFFIRSVWRTQHRPIVEVSAEDSEDVDVAEAAVIVVVDAAVVVVVDVAKTRKNGFPSPNLDVSVWALSAPKKWPPPSVVPLSWPSSQSFPFVVVSGVTKLDVPIPFLARSLASAVLSG